MTARKIRLLGAVAGGAATLVVINGLGCVTGAGRPGYASTRGIAGMVFTFSLMALPVGMVVGLLLAGLFARRRRPPAA